jgi:16S rRNA (cytidine1402-2'-O)-methyltransferase
MCRGGQDVSRFSSSAQTLKEKATVRGTLYVVATPIGNLEDLTPRARRTLAEVDLIAAEDTRHTGRLLSHIGVKARQIPLHEHNESAAAGGLVDALVAGSDVALVSDAGTPLVSDPGFRLVRAAQDAGIRVVPIPGPSAITAALSAAGLPTDRFAFEGFLPPKAAARRRALAALAAEPRTLVFFESVHRVAATLADCCKVFGREREAFVGRELTKLHEQCLRAPLGELAEALGRGTITGKGEFVIAVAGGGGTQEKSADVDRLLRELGAVLPAAKAAAAAARITGLPRKSLYARLVEISDADPAGSD